VLRLIGHGELCAVNCARRIVLGELCVVNCANFVFSTKLF
jgi:hypothetical protein